MTDTNTADPFAQTNAEQINHLETLVGEGKKFADVNALAKGKYEADTFIEQLKRENDELRRKAEKGMAIEDLYNAIKTNPPASDGQPPLKPQDVDKTASPPVVDEDLIKTTLSKIEAERKAAENKTTVVAKLSEVWGNGVSENLRKASNELGISITDLEEMGKRSPQALFKLLGVENANRAPSGTTAPTSTVNLPSTNNGVRTWQYYQRMKAQDRKLYDSPKVQVQMLKDAQTLKEKFFD